MIIIQDKGFSKELFKPQLNANHAFVAIAEANIAQWWNSDASLIFFKVCNIPMNFNGKEPYAQLPGTSTGVIRAPV